ncbi:hypothetical protein GCM10023322_75450 [Rugosimonospora acidiphila]|uniref:Uncharacterized protein n=2 Tax=Rugosimonospora acidiphila TaxID=556531 RepID=A0ABP9SQY1_9ACTN
MRAGEEQLIGALIPPKIANRADRVPAPMPVLPRLSLPSDQNPDGLVLGMARLDRSGRLSARDLLGALGWQPGHRIDIGIVAGVLVASSSPTGQHVVHGRGELSLPATARSMCNLPPGVSVLLAASPAQNVLVIHPVATVARLLIEHHARLTAGGEHV